jgi:hypothetical protein
MNNDNINNIPHDDLAPDFSGAWFMKTGKGSLSAGDIKKDIENRLSVEMPDNSFFVTVPAAVWVADASLRPTPKRLFDDLCFEGEFCILYSDTNLGKSCLAVQVADSITRGRLIDGFALEADPQPVLYFDFELSDKQFQLRYCDDANTNFLFDGKFLRAELNPNAALPEGFTLIDDFIISSIEKEIVKTGARILIVDNITYLRSETEKAKDALPLMKMLKDLKKKYGLSIMALAHTPKRDMTKPITKNDLAGSKMLINFCDSAFAIGESNRDPALRYIKQMKQRNCGHRYDADNVIEVEIKKEGSFLGFTLIGYGRERPHLYAQMPKGS